MYYKIIGLLLMVFSLNVAGTLKTHKIVAEYEEVMEILQMAITDKGLVISKIFHISQMLKRTANLTKNSTKIYDKSEIVTFCSAVLSRQLMAINPEHISYCPYKINIYKTANDNTIYLSYEQHTLLNTKAQRVMDKINYLLADIINHVRKEL